MNKTFTKAQFSGVANEMAKLAKKIAEYDGFTSSISFDKECVSMSIHSEHGKECRILYFHKSRFCGVKQMEEFLDFIKDIQLTYGKYFTMMLDAYNECDKNEYYFDY